MTEGHQHVIGSLVSGHGVASGQGGDPRFPEGTLRLQMLHFAKEGVDLSAYFPGTLNLSIAPHQFRVKKAPVTLRRIRWCEVLPPEDFSFLPCSFRRVAKEGAEDGFREGLVYYPHPETKPDHFQPPSVLEILAPWTEGLTPGTEMELRVGSEFLDVVEG
ncbi:MAG: hypothetical protein AAF191_04015 [Verrucomicrobiota bacterium]